MSEALISNSASRCSGGRRCSAWFMSAMSIWASCAPLTASLAVNGAQLAHMDMADMNHALQRLPPEQREALLLISASDMSYEEAASVCGVAVGTIKSRVNRGRAKLAKFLFVEDGN